MQEDIRIASLTLKLEVGRIWALKGGGAHWMTECDIVPHDVKYMLHVCERRYANSARFH